MTAKKPEPKTMTPEEMRLVIEQERQGRIDACTRELQAVIQPVLDKHRCSFIPEITLRGNAQSAQMTVLAND